MPKYRKKPVVIEAILLDFINDPPLVFEYMGKTFETGFCSDGEKLVPCLEIETLEGTMKAFLGDYLICGIKNEFYPCKPDIFELTYEEVK